MKAKENPRRSPWFRAATAAAILGAPVLAIAAGSPVSAGHAPEVEISVTTGCDENDLPYIEVEVTETGPAAAKTPEYSVYVKASDSNWNKRLGQAFRKATIGEVNDNLIFSFSNNKDGLKKPGLAYVQPETNYDIIITEGDKEPKGKYILDSTNVTSADCEKSPPPDFDFDFDVNLSTTTTVAKVLPKTGSDSGSLLLVAPVMVLLGGGLVLARRRFDTA